MNKNTTELLDSLQNCEEFGSYYNQNSEYFISGNLAKCIDEIISHKNIKKCDLIHKADMSDVYGYQILSGLRRPKRDKLIALCLAMELELHEVQTLLKVGSYPVLYAKNPRDSVIIFGICNKMELLKINELLSRIDAGEAEEVIIATNPDVEGEATAMYIAKMLKNFGIKTTRIARGIPVGGDLEYADKLTLARSFRGRTEV